MYHVEEKSLEREYCRENMREFTGENTGEFMRADTCCNPVILTYRGQKAPSKAKRKIFLKIIYKKPKKIGNKCIESETPSDNSHIICLDKIIKGAGNKPKPNLTN